MQAYEAIKKIVADMEPDVQKAEGGNKAAGTRVRQQAQDLKKAAQELREAILQMRGAESNG